MSDITLSAGVRQNLLSLQNTADLMATTQSRLATGKKVNSALDNPTNFFTSQSLNNRASDLSSLLDSMSNGKKTLEAADNGITALTKSIESMQATVRQARQDASFKASSITLDDTTLAASTTQKSISFTGGEVGNTAVSIDLLSSLGNGGTATAGTFATSSFTAMTLDAASTDTAGTSVATYSNTMDFANGGSNDGSLTFNINVDGGGATAVTVSYANVAAVGNNDGVIDSAAELQAAVDLGLAAAGVNNVTTSLNGNDLTFTSNSTGATSSVAITGAAGSNGVVAANSGLTAPTETAGAAAQTADTLSFDIAVDGGSATTVTIDRSVVAGVGNNDGTIDSNTELAAAINAAMTTAGVTGVTAATNTGGGITFTSASTGSDSAIAITNAAVANNNTTTALSDTSGLSGGTATAGLDGSSTLKTVDALVTEINANTSLSGKVKASNDNGKLRIENLSTSDLTVTGVGSTSGEIDGSTGTSTISGNTVRRNLANQFNELRNQLNKLADDASYNGINLLKGDKLRLTFNENGTSTIDIQAKDADGNVRAINTSTLSIDASTVAEFSDDDSLDARLSALSDALSTLRTQSSDFGSNLSIVENRTEFTKNMINTLQTGADNLVLADSNEEAANMLALQTRQQLSSTALSLASQADQAVLRLF
ncbi:MAG: flagellin [Hyphomicrobiales bacterium]